MTKPKVRQDVSELSLLFEIGQILDSTVDLQHELSPILKTIADHTGMLRGTLTLIERDTGGMYIEAAYGLSSEERDRGRYHFGEGIVGQVVQTGKPMVIPKISEEPMFLNRTGARRNLKKQDISYICVPIKIENETIGALSADHVFERTIELEEDARLLSIIASLIANAVKLRQEASELRRRLLEENTRLQAELKDRFKPANIIGNAGSMQPVYDLINQVAKSDATVMIRGESGVGKELIANAIHYNSMRAAGPLIKVNCAALPDSIIESELFGHEVGAFTGAVSQRQGRFELAHGGTIFLDEIGDISATTQVRLLRVLQEREFERVGGMEPIKVDVRVIASTNRDLEDLMVTETFRSDLYYRLNVFPIHVPPLRERRTDVLLLSDHFVEKFSKANRKNVRRISTAAIDLLSCYHWPGNVRELENCIERAVLLTNDDVIHAHHLPPTLQTGETSDTVVKGTLQATLDRVERDMLIEALKEARGNRAKAARQLGISERIMGLRVNQHGIDSRQYREIKVN